MWFTAAHELAHLLLHGDAVPGDVLQEKEADAFAAEFMTPSAVIRPQLPARMDLKALERLGQQWGVSVDSLVYRCREVGAVSDPAYRRAYQRLNQLRKLGLFQSEPVDQYPGEVPALIIRADGLQRAHPRPSEYPLTCAFTIPHRVESAFCPPRVRGYRVA